jgi:hypothetical protein
MKWMIVLESRSGLPALIITVKMEKSWEGKFTVRSALRIHNGDGSVFDSSK